MSKEQLRAQLNVTIGEVTEEELMELSGAYDVDPNTTPLTTSSWTCITFATATVCPSNVCTSKC
ncbi:class II lanthipeptide, LchA2/BrtA2 family [Ureibacillus aquaedulcis]|uniref:Class II lanthipeptide, LchA2/BrtA2 family n=1 Tax=Ureibacillus aquaedulcis TaxID=3058421 RepID=A0ABT8GVU0_9BACL|nr:class II lanthipeptide, LchA2/BrtA2 family [Ureibacillus sp. BA0131]MDN4495531.1 class II lanthipeptide, LchA2/BrtA2 family [Ureibacillus sp. BA0131]